MLRYALPLLTGLGLAVALAACGDDTSSNGNCGPGTVLQNGVCVPDNTTDTFTGGDAAVTDTNTTTQPPTDTSTNPTDTGGGGQDTAQPDTFNPTDCTPDELSSKGLGVPCSRDCECDAGLGLSCYNGVYLQGLSFCTRHTQGPLNLNTTASILIVPGCFEGNIGSDANLRLYSPKCESAQWCKDNLGSQYTHCGTQALGYGSFDGTECKQVASGTLSTLSAAKACIIDTALPFSTSLDL